MINSVTISGKVYGVPIVKKAGKGTVCTVNIINSEPGDSKKTHFVKCEAWQAAAKDLQSLREDDKVTFAGKLIQNSWKDDAGQEQSMTKVRASGMAPVLQANKAYISGKVITPPTCKTVGQNNTKICSFVLENVEPGIMGRSDKIYKFECEGFEDVADSLELLNVGELVTLSGSITQHSFEVQGSKKSVIRIRVDDCSGSQGTPQVVPTQNASAPAAQEAPFDVPDNDEEVGF